MKNKNSWYFLIFIVLVYLILYFVSPHIFLSSISFFKKTFIKIIPVFGLVFILMVIVNRYIDNDFIINHIRGNKIKSWMFLIIGGILSTGPVYLWYPLLKDLRSNGVSNGEIACFLYNRSIKPAFFPLIILYFGARYMITLTLIMIIASLVQAFFIEKLAPFTEKQTD